MCVCLLSTSLQGRQRFFTVTCVWREAKWLILIYFCKFLPYVFSLFILPIPTQATTCNYQGCLAVQASNICFSFQTGYHHGRHGAGSRACSQCHRQDPRHPRGDDGGLREPRHHGPDPHLPGQLPVSPEPEGAEGESCEWSGVLIQVIEK